MLFCLVYPEMVQFAAIIDEHVHRNCVSCTWLVGFIQDSCIALSFLLNVSIDIVH